VDGSDCHAKVEKISDKLEARGWRCWLDKNDMGQDVKTSMAQGIEESKAVLIFLSKAYMQKVAADKLQDNVVFEYKHTMNQKGADGMFVPVVMETFSTDKGAIFPDDTRAWTGRIGAEIGTHLQVRMQGCFDDEAKLDGKIDELEDLLWKLLPEKQEQQSREREYRRRSGTGAGSSPSSSKENYHLVSPSLERSSVVLVLVTGSDYSSDRPWRLEIELMSSFGRPAGEPQSETRDAKMERMAPDFHSTVVQCLSSSASQPGGRLMGLSTASSPRITSQLRMCTRSTTRRCVHVCVYARVRVSVCACMLAWVCPCVRACVWVWPAAAMTRAQRPAGAKLGGRENHQASRRSQAESAPLHAHTGSDDPPCHPLGQHAPAPEDAQNRAHARLIILGRSRARQRAYGFQEAAGVLRRRADQGYDQRL